MQVFKTDFGGTYMLHYVLGNVLSATGERTGTTYTSLNNRLVITGKTRNQGTMRNAYPYSVGQGQRAILVLDTGEGIEEIRGVVLR